MKKLIEQILKFGVVGVVCFFIDFVITLVLSAICRSAGMDTTPAALVGAFWGFTISVIINYLLSGDANDIFWAIFSFGSIIFMLCYVYMFAAFIKLKLTDDTPRAYEVPGGKGGAWLVTILCEAGVLLAIYFLMVWDPADYTFWMISIGTLLTIITGLWLYKAGNKKA